MSLATEVRAVLTGDATVAGIVGERVYPDIIAQDAPMPAIAYSLVTGQREVVLRGSCDLDNARYQFDSYALKAMDADALREAVIAALEATASFAVVQGTRLDFYEADTKRYRRTVEFSIWRNDAGSP